jgi:hypothetical protein
MTELNVELFELEREVGARARAALLAAPAMGDTYAARLDARMRRLAASQGEARGWLSLGFGAAPRGAIRLGVATALAISLAVAGGSVIPSDAPAADARELVVRVLAANQAGSVTAVPPGKVRHMTVVTTTVGAASAPVVYEEWFGDQGKSVRLAFGDSILVLADGVGWMYLPKEQLARPMALSEKRFEALGLGRFALSSATVADGQARIVGRATSLGRPATVVELAAKPIDPDRKNAAAARMRYQIVVDDATYEIRESRAATLDSAGAVLDEVVTRVTLDELLDATQFAPDFFRFVPPSGTTIEVQ